MSVRGWWSRSAPEAACGCTPKPTLSGCKGFAAWSGDLRVNLAGCDIILQLTQRIDGLQAEVDALRQELQRERDRHLPAPSSPFGQPEV